MTMNNEQYRRQVALLIHIMPAVFRIQDFAVHGGNAINLFHQNMPRYSVDIDVTYIPIAPRETSLEAINAFLSKLKTNIERTIPGIKIIHRPDVWKLQSATKGQRSKSKPMERSEAFSKSPRCGIFVRKHRLCFMQIAKHELYPTPSSTKGK